MTASCRCLVCLGLIVGIITPVIPACSTGTVTSHTESLKPRIGTDESNNKPYNATRKREYSDSVAILKGYEVSIDGKKADANSERFAEVRDAVSQFMDELRNTGIFIDVNPENEIPHDAAVKRLYLKFDDEEDLNRANAAAQAFFVALFTLGMGNAGTTETYDYSTHVTLNVHHDSKTTDTYEAVAKTSERYRQLSSQGRTMGMRKARVSVTENALKSLLEQLLDVSKMQLSEAVNH